MESILKPTTVKLPTPKVKSPRDPNRDQELIDILITCDGKGKKEKTKALKELLDRAALYTEFGLDHNELFKENMV